MRRPRWKNRGGACRLSCSVNSPTKHTTAGTGTALATLLTAAKGVLHESATICGNAFDAILTLSEAQRVPLNVLVAAAAVAVDASLRQNTETLLVHTVDNRFGDSDLNVATCLVNSVAQTVRFPHLRRCPMSFERLTAAMSRR